MKFMHLSDLHLGKRLIEVSLLEDQKYILDQIIHIVEEEKPQAVLISGDIYDRSNPPEEAMTLFGHFIRRLTEAGCKVLVISGNHDSSERVAYLGELVRENGVYLSPVYNGHLESVTLEDEFGAVNFYLMPYIHPEAVKRFFPEETIAGANDAARLVLGESAPDTSIRNVILSHQLILGSSFDEREQKAVGTLDNVDPKLYEGFDYVALGHIHNAQFVGRKDKTMRYCGTPLVYSKKEARTAKPLPLGEAEPAAKTVTMVDLKKKGDVSCYEIPLSPLREVRLVKGEFNTLLEKGPDAGSEDDYYYITLTDEDDVIPNAAVQLRSRFGKVLEIDFDNARTRAGEEVSIGTVEAEEKTPMELLSDLYRLMRQHEMSEEAKAFAREVMQETEGFQE